MSKKVVVGLGTWAIGGGEWWGDSDREQSIQTIQKAIEEGISLIDTAPCYGFGTSETIVGEAIKGQRDKVTLSTKCGLWWHDERGSAFFDQAGYNVNRCLEPDTIKREIELSLNRLGTDYIDIYFTHWQSIEPYKTPIKDTMNCLMDLKRQGMIKQIGASNVDENHIKEYLEYGKLDLIQEKYSMLDRRIEEILIPCCKANDIGIMAYSPLEQGLLTGKVGMDYVVGEKEARAGIPWYKLENRKRVIDMLDGWSDLTAKYDCAMAQLVTAWTGMQEGITSVLCGARKPHHISETAKTVKVVLEAEDCKRMRRDIENLGEAK